MESEVLNMDNGIFLTVNILIVLTTLIFLKLVGGIFMSEHVWCHGPSCHLNHTV
jgi:hypothetical protein